MSIAMNGTAVILGSTFNYNIVLKAIAFYEIDARNRLLLFTYTS